MPPTVSSPTSASPAPTERPVAFGKYRLHHRIARGGMGEVYRASLVGELGFEKPLVIKTILPELAAQPRFIEMFAAEAKTAVALSHGNIVPIYELGRAEDTFYIVMGYVDGPSVAELLAAHRRRGHPPPIGVALSIARGVLSGLAYAHTDEPGRHAVVHRDITPRNVMIDRSGQVRIVDFGIASPVRATVAVRGGSTGYVAPEQARAGTVDPRADVFSTACLLYELLTLERAFPHEGVWVAPDVTKLPDAVRTALSRALALDPSERPADASAFLSTLGEAITRHAATFSESDLAAHLRMLCPDGRWTTIELDVEGVTPSTAVRPTTMTFATRLTAITEANDGHDGPATPADDARPPSGSAATTHATAHERPASARRVAPARRRGLVAALAVTTAGLVGAWLWASASPVPPRDLRAAGASDASARGSGPAQHVTHAGSLAPAAPSQASASAMESHESANASEGDPPHPGGTTNTATDATAPPPALVLHVQPEGATVRIGTQRFEGRSPFVLPLPTHGELEALVEHPGHQPQTVELRAGEPGERSLVLRPIAAPVAPQGRGSLQVLAPSVSWAEVTVDGRRFGVTPTRKLELAAGDHRVVVRCVPDVCPEPRILLRRTVEIEAGDTLRLVAE